MAYDEVDLSEKTYYKIVSDWLVGHFDGVPVGTDYRIEGLSILTGDVVVRRGGQLYVCEMKDIAYPLGSAGSGAVGQAPGG